jgi:hypothetical protein
LSDLHGHSRSYHSLTNWLVQPLFDHRNKESNVLTRIAITKLQSQRAGKIQAFRAKVKDYIDTHSLEIDFNSGINAPLTTDEEIPRHSFLSSAMPLKKSMTGYAASTLYESRKTPGRPVRLPSPSRKQYPRQCCECQGPTAR